MNPKITIADIASTLNISRQAVLQKLKSSNIEYQISSNKSYLTHTQSKKFFDLNNFHKVACVQIVKGGSGKTAITLALAIRASLYGAKVLLIDLDQQANLTDAFRDKSWNDKLSVYDILKNGAKIKDCIQNVLEGIDIIPSKIDNALIDDLILFDNLSLDRVYKKLIDSIKKTYNLILIDCPPSLGRSVGAAAIASDYIIAPVTPDQACIRGLGILDRQLSLLTKKYDCNPIPYKIILNKYDGRTILSRKTISALLEHNKYKESLFASYIRINQIFANCYNKGISIYDTVKSSTAQEDIDLLTREVLELYTEKEINQKISLP